MFTQIIGAAGSGKSKKIYSLAAEKLRRSRTVFLIVPEQTAVEAERCMAELCAKEGIPSVSLEVVSFRRLANRVFRTVGGLSYRYIGQGGKNIVMWRTLCELAPMLRVYGTVSLSDTGTLSSITAALDEFKQYGISARTLSEAADTLEQDGNTRLSDKIFDLSLILSTYNTIMKTDYDDPRDDIPRLAEALGNDDFFRGTDVFCDSFYGFTPDEADVLYHAARQADNFTISLQSAEPSSSFADSIALMRRQIDRICPDVSEKETIIMQGDARHVSPGIATVGAFLRGEAYDRAEEQDGGVTLIECADRYEEAEAAAMTVLSHIRAGGSYRDCSIIVRNTETWRGIIDPVLRSHGIPCFMSDRSDVLSGPAPRLITAALDAVGGGWSLSDMVAIIKTGLSGLSQEEGDILEEYATSWRISGRRWHDEYEWNMNPRGYVEKLGEADEYILRIANEARRKLTEPLSMLALGRSTVRNYCTAIYEYITALGIPSLMEQTGEEEPVQIWNAITDALDCLVTVAGELPVTASVMAKLMRAVLTGVNVGRIPTCTDEVRIGGADLFRPSRCRCAILLGCTEGEFPAAVQERGLFSDAEKVALEGVDVVLSARCDARASDEQLYFYMAACAPSEQLTLTYSLSDGGGRTRKPSVGWQKVRQSMPHLSPLQFSEIPPETRLQSKKAAFDYAAATRSPHAQEILSLLANGGDTERKLDALGSPLSVERARLCREITDRIYGDKINISNTTIENYTKCAFGCFCKNILGLREPFSASFSGADAGNYIHTMLQSFCTAVRDKAFDPETATDAEYESFIDAENERYIQSVMRGTEPDARQKNLFRRLRRTASLIVRDLSEELRSSGFRPTFFELPVSHGTDAVPPIKIPLESGGSAEVVGRIDRVDLMRNAGDMFVRVTDYKTGTIPSIRDSVNSGIGMQLLLYLSSLCADDRRVKRLLSDGESMACGEEGVSLPGRVIPAAALYMAARTPELSTDGPYSDGDDPNKAAAMEFSRIGLVSDDPTLLAKMDDDKSGHFIPAKGKIAKDGEISFTGSLCSAKEFEDLCSDACKKAASVAQKMRDGTIDAIPMKTPPHTASVCEYCAMRPLCRRTDK